MKRKNLNYQNIKDMREDGLTLNKISEITECSVPTVMRFISKNKLKLKQQYQLGKKQCCMCNHFFFKKDLKCCGAGQFCRECYKRRFYYADTVVRYIRREIR